jgi:hypothetical protein
MKWIWSLPACARGREGKAQEHEGDDGQHHSAHTDSLL